VDGSTLKKRLMDILACPIDKFYPLELMIFEEKEEVISGLITCPKCNRWYPIIDEIPHMLPDELRDGEDDIPFIRIYNCPIFFRFKRKNKRNEVKFGIRIAEC
jgi:uncharacterized protein YbaR (Trm112 family)